MARSAPDSDPGDDARTSWRQARACSGLTSRLILAYVEREAGRTAVEQLLVQAGMSDREVELRDENSWFSFETKLKLWDAAVAVTGDPKIAEHAGEAALEFGIALGLKRALRALGSPDFVYRNVARANGKFNSTHQFEAVVSEPGHIRLAFRDVSGTGYHPYDCEYTIGLLRTVPQLFGFPPARISHQFCGCRGADHCEYDVQWVAGIATGTRPIVIAGAAGVVFAATGAIFDPFCSAQARASRAPPRGSRGSVRRCSHAGGSPHSRRAYATRTSGPTRSSRRWRRCHPNSDSTTCWMRSPPARAAPWAGPSLRC
jgi:hypothetical protein